MFFVIGFVLMLLGAVILNVQNKNYATWHRTLSRWDYVGTTILLVGLGLVAYSLCSLAWRHLP